MKRNENSAKSLKNQFSVVRDYPGRLNSPVQTDLQRADAGLLPILNLVAPLELLPVLDGGVADGVQAGTVGGVQDVVQLPLRGEDGVPGISDGVQKKWKIKYSKLFLIKKNRERETDLHKEER